MKVSRDRTPVTLFVAGPSLRGSTGTLKIYKRKAAKAIKSKPTASNVKISTKGRPRGRPPREKKPIEEITPASPSKLKGKKPTRSNQQPKYPIRSSLNPLVEARPSLIPNAGLGLFALEDIPKNSLIATYGGKLVDYEEARYLDPEYSVDFELGKGNKLIGDDELEDLGIYANAIHPLNKDVKQNARFCLGTKEYLPNSRGRYKITAQRDILEGEEIIVSYGRFYWKACQDFKENPPVKPLTAVARDERASRRTELSEVIKRSMVVK